MAGANSAEAPAPFNTSFQAGYVILLDDTRVEGDIALGGRCLSDIYTISMKNTRDYITVGSKAQQFANQGIISLGKFSVKEFGLDDVSENETDDSLYSWFYPFESRGYMQALSAEEKKNITIDSLGISRYAGHFFKNDNKGFFHHEILKSKTAPGYLNLKNETEVKGDLQLTKLNGTVVEINLFMNGDKKPTPFSLNDVLSYGLIFKSQSSNTGNSESTASTTYYPKNETPSTFEWSGTIVKSKNSKNADGYLILKDDRRIQGEIKLKYFFVEGYTIASIKPEGEKKWVDYKMDDLKAYGINGGAKDESINETATLFKWEESKMNENMRDQWGEIWDPGKKQSVIDEGYLVLKNGTKLEGTMYLQGRIYFTTDVYIKGDGQDYKHYTIEEVAKYGLSSGESETPKANRSEFVASNILQLKPIEVNGLKVATNPKLIRRYYDDGSMESEFKAGYIVNTDGETILGELQEKEAYDIKSLKFQEFEGRKYDMMNMIGKLKKDFVEYGYINEPVISEFPLHLYTDKRDGYITLIDGRTVHGKIKISYPKDGIIRSVGSTLDKCGTVTTISYAGKKANKTRLIENAHLYDEIFYVKIKKGEEKLKDIKNDLILRMGLDDVRLEELNFSDEQLVDNDKMNFHPGSIETKDGKKESGFVAYIQGNEANSYYGVYFAKGQQEFVIVYRMNELKSVNQEIYDDIEAFDPFGEGVIESMEMGSETNLKPNGRIVFSDGSTKKGHLSLYKSQKLWYVYSIKFVDENGISTTFDQNNTFKEAYMNSAEREIKFVPYAGVICEVIMESAPYMYFRNPFPKKETGFSRMLNQAIAESSASMMESAATEFAKTDKISAEDKFLIVNSIDESKIEAVDVDVKVNKKEYILYDTKTKIGYVVVNGGVAPYIADIDDLKNGCVEYLRMTNERRKQLNTVVDRETGLGMQAQIDFLCNCYHPEMVKE